MACAAQVVTPGSERVIRGEGMPISKAPGQKGNLRLQMDVQARALLHALPLRCLPTCVPYALRALALASACAHHHSQVSERTVQGRAERFSGVTCLVLWQCIRGTAGSMSVWK